MKLIQNLTYYFKKINLFVPWILCLFFGFMDEIIDRSRVDEGKDVLIKMSCLKDNVHFIRKTWIF